MSLMFRLVHRAFWWLQSWLTPASLTPLAPVEQLSDAVVRVLGCNSGPMTLQGTNTYLIGTGTRRVLLDTGSPHISQYIQRLEAVLSDNNAQLQEVLLTHWHSDHVGGVSAVRKQFGNIVVRKYPCPDHPIEDCFLDLKDGEVIRTEGATLKVMHTPGHTSDHVAVHLVEENALFSGDCILGETTAVFEDLREYLRSLETIRQLSPTVIYPGHGPVVDDPVARAEAYIAHRLQRERQIVSALETAGDGALNAAELVDEVYATQRLSYVMQRAARANVVHHIAKLVADGTVEKRHGDKYSIRRPSRSV